MPRSKRPAAAGLPATERIRKRAAYVRIQGSGRKITSPHLLAFVASSSQECSRVGVTVSRRVGKAVVRNRVKRLLRESFRQQKQRFPRGTDIVLVARPQAADASYRQIFQELEEICRRSAGGGERSPRRP